MATPKKPAADEPGVISHEPDEIVKESLANREEQDTASEEAGDVLREAMDDPDGDDPLVEVTQQIIDPGTGQGIGERTIKVPASRAVYESGRKVVDSAGVGTPDGEKKSRR